MIAPKLGAGSTKGPVRCFGFFVAGAVIIGLGCSSAESFHGEWDGSQIQTPSVLPPATGGTGEPGLGGGGGSLVVSSGGTGGGSGSDAASDTPSISLPGSGGSTGGGGSPGVAGTGGTGGTVATGPCAGVAPWSAASAPTYPIGVKVLHGTPARLFQGKPYPEGAWCRIPEYEPQAANGYWVNAWNDLGPCP